MVGGEGGAAGTARRCAAPLLAPLRLLLALVVAAALLAPVCGRAMPSQPKTGNSSSVGLDYELSLPQGMYNPSLVVYRGTAYFVARTTRVRRDASGLKWIINTAHLCAADPDAPTLPPRCAPFDPWRGAHTECRWGSETYKVPWEATGVDDTKLFVWPGRGVWGLTGRRPARSPGGKPWCKQPVVWRQFLFQLAREGEDLDLQRWAVASPEAPPGVTWAPEAAPAAAAAAASPQAGRGLLEGIKPPALLQEQGAAGGRKQRQRRWLLLLVGGGGGIGGDGGPLAAPRDYVSHVGRPLLESEEELVAAAEELTAAASEARAAARLATFKATTPLLIPHLEAAAAREAAAVAAAEAATAAAQAAAAVPDAAAGGSADTAGTAARRKAGVKPHQLLIGQPLQSHHRRACGAVAARLRAGGEEEPLLGWHEAAALPTAGVMGRTVKRMAVRRRLVAVEATVEGAAAEGTVSSDRGLQQLVEGGAGDGLSEQEQEQQPRRRRRRRRRPALEMGQGEEQAAAAQPRRRRRHRRWQLHPPAAAAAAALLPPAPSSGGSAAAARPPNQQQQQRKAQGWDALWDAPPLALSLSDASAVYGRRHSVYEKNWMPFTAGRDQLYAVHSVGPHYRVYQLHPNGTAAPLSGTAPPHAGGEGGGGAEAALGGLEVAAGKVHGGPPLVLVELERWRGTMRDPQVLAAVKGLSSYYLGVLHFWVPRPGGGPDARTYKHFLFRASAKPPFRLTQVSAELPLKTHPRYRAVTFASGLHLRPPPPATAATAKAESSSQPRLLISYGSGDASGRVLELTLEEAERLLLAGPGGKANRP